MPGTTLSDPLLTFRDAARAASIASCMASLGHGALSVLVVVPTAAHQRHAVAAWAASTPGGRPPVVMPMDRFIAHLADAMIPGDIGRVDDADATLILEQAAQLQGLRLGGLGLSLTDLHQFVYEGYTASSIAEMVDDGDPSPRKQRRLMRLHRLWTTYDALLGERGLDRSNVLRAVIAALHARKPLSLHVRDISAPVSQVIVRDVVALTDLERTLLMALADHGWKIAIRWTPDAEWTKDPTDDHDERRMVHGEFVRDRSMDQITELVAHGWHHVNEDVPPGLPQASIVACDSPADEVRRVITAIKELCFSEDNGIRPHDICVVVPRMHQYEAALRDLARSAGVPMTGGDRIELAATNPGATVLTACDVIGGRWRRVDVDRLHRCDLPSDVLADLHDVIAAANAERIVGGEGPASWMTFIEQRYTTLLQFADRSDDRELIVVLRRLRDGLDALQRVASLLPVVSGTLTPHDFATIITNTVIKGLGLEQAAYDLRQRADASDRPCADVDAVRALQDIAMRYADVMAAIPNGRRSFEEHALAFRRLVQSSTVRIPDVRLDGVALVRPADTRGRRWKVAFSVGWTEGAFPSTPRTEHLQADLLVGRQAQLDMEALLDVVRCVDPATGRLVVSWPMRSDETETLPSHFLEKLKACTSLQVTTGIRAYDERDHAIITLDERNLRSGSAIHVARQQHGLVMRDCSARTRDALRTAIARPLSPSRLNGIASCPYQYFASQLLQVSSDASDEDRLSPMERGGMLHDIVSTFFRHIRGLQHGAIDEQDLVQALQHPLDLAAYQIEYLERELMQVARTIMPRYDSHHTYSMAEQRVLLGSDAYRGLLQRWLAMEHGQARNGAPRPAAFEVQIKTDVTFADGTTETLNVRVDRIDISMIGEQAALVVIDYKNTSRSVPTYAEMKAGKELQMPMYVHAVDSACRQLGINATVRSAQYVPFGRNILDKESVTRSARMLDPDVRYGETARPKSVVPFETHLAIATQVLLDVRTTLRSGDLPVSPRDGACNVCGYGELCRIDTWGAAAPPSLLHTIPDHVT